MSVHKHSRYYYYQHRLHRVRPSVRQLKRKHCDAAPLILGIRRFSAFASLHQCILDPIGPLLELTVFTDMLLRASVHAVAPAYTVFSDVHLQPHPQLCLHQHFHCGYQPTVSTHIIHGQIDHHGSPIR